MINSKLFLSELELITLADDFLLCVNKTRRQSSCFAAHSTVKLTRGKGPPFPALLLTECMFTAVFPRLFSSDQLF